MFGWLRRLFGAPPADPLADLDAPRVRLIVGLGNPGEEYADTRHNLGFRCVEVLAQRCSAAWVNHARSVVAVAHPDAVDLVLAKPQTYMNRSGEAIVPLRDRLAIQNAQLLVVYDDMDLPLGALRLRERGSPGTHNGMRSVVRELDSDAVPRLRIGIGQATPGNATQHVLSEFSPEEQAAIDSLVQRAADTAFTWATLGATVAMNRYNRT